MKSKTFTLITSMTLFAALSVPARLTARDHSRYKLIDLGTFGGPHGYGSVNGDGFSLINNSGVVASFADTALPDPNAPNHCFDPDCFLAHAFRWKDGVLTDLGALHGKNNNSAAGSINARGWMTGQSQTGLFDPILNGPGVHAVLWKHGHITDLGSLGGNASLGIYVNDAGQVIGLSDNTTPDPFSLFGIGVQIRTFLWEDGLMRDIGTLGGPDSLPGASCSGQPRHQIVGASYTSFIPNPSTGVPTLDPYLWNNGVMTDLGNLGGTMGAAQCINNRGQIIGMATLAGDLVNHAFFWDDGVMKDLGTLGGDNSQAIWLNDAGDVVGSADLAGPTGNQTHDAVLWRDGKIHDLGTVPGDPCSRGRGLNSRGQVVGGSSDCHNFLHAFVWEEGAPMLDLNTLIAPGSGYQLTNAININDRGEILAKADPIGVPPIDDQDLGHLMLLIPCEADDDEGCEANATAANTAAGHILVPVIRSTAATAAERPLTLDENVGGWPAPLARQYCFSGMAAPKN
jgi:probable HAF family extracellular repeat protein